MARCVQIYTLRIHIINIHILPRKNKIMIRVSVHVKIAPSSSKSIKLIDIPCRAL